MQFVVERSPRVLTVKFGPVIMTHGASLEVLHQFRTVSRSGGGTPRRSRALVTLRALFGDRDAYAIRVGLTEERVRCEFLPFLQMSHITWHSVTGRWLRRGGEPSVVRTCAPAPRREVATTRHHHSHPVKRQVALLHSASPFYEETAASRLAEIPSPCTAPLCGEDACIAATIERQPVHLIRRSPST